MRNRWLSGMALAAILMLTGCGDGPTAPMTPTPSSLVGEWHGTMSYPSGECGSEEVSVSANVEEERVRMDVQSRCYGRVMVLRLGNWGAGPRGQAAMQLTTCASPFGAIHNPTLTADVTGTADQGRLHLETTMFRSGNGFVICSRPAATLELVR